MLVKADQKFYSNNFLDFVHLNYLSEILKLVPDVITTNEKQETVNQYIISEDENSENPIKIVGTDKVGNKTEFHLKPEITKRVNELIRDNIKVVVDEENQNWKTLTFSKDTNHDYFELSAKLDDGNTVNTILPSFTADDLKTINRIKAYDNKLEVDYLEENSQGEIVEQTKVYDLNNYVLKSVYDNKMEQIDDTLANIGEVHQLSDKACEYICTNHGKIGYCIIYNLGETTHQLVNFDVDFQGCLNQSLVAGQEWNVHCVPTDLTNTEAFDQTKDWIDCLVEMEYDDGTIKRLDGQCNFNHVRFTVPTDAQRNHIKRCRMNAILYFA